VDRASLLARAHSDLFGGYFVTGRVGVHLLLMSAGAGAIGAILSITIGIRARTVAIEGDRRSNAVDAAVRVAIRDDIGGGAVSAAQLRHRCETSVRAESR